jgi:hypothetical protein
MGELMGIDETGEWMRRDKWRIPKFDDSLKTLEKSKKECADLTKMNELVLILGLTLVAMAKIPNFFDEMKEISDRYTQSLVFTSLMELIRASGRTVFLSGCGLYTNAYHNIRYCLESAIQSMYIDSKHPETDFSTKIEILKEVEDLPDYRGIQLVKKLDIECKKEINQEYKKLSARVHFRHEQFEGTASDVMSSTFILFKQDCKEVTNLYDSMRMLYDIFFLLLFTSFPEIKEELKKNAPFIELIRDHNLRNLSKVFGIR